MGENRRSHWFFNRCGFFVFGGSFIAYRFEGWYEVIRRLGLPRPNTPPDSKRRKIYKDEYRRQVRLLKQENITNCEKRKEAKEERAEAGQLAGGIGAGRPSHGPRDETTHVGEDG